MLPFLKQRKSDATIAVEYRKPDQEDSMESDTLGLEAAAADLITAIHNKDKKLAVEALKSFFEISDSMPHVEGPHEDSSLE